MAKSFISYVTISPVGIQKARGLTTTHPTVADKTLARIVSKNEKKKGKRQPLSRKKVRHKFLKIIKLTAATPPVVTS